MILVSVRRIIDFGAASSSVVVSEPGVLLLALVGLLSAIFEEVRPMTTTLAVLLRSYVTSSPQETNFSQNTNLRRKGHSILGSSRSHPPQKGP